MAGVCTPGSTSEKPSCCAIAGAPAIAAAATNSAAAAAAALATAPREPANLRELPLRVDMADTPWITVGDGPSVR